MNLEAIKFDDDLEMSVFIPEQQDSIRLVLSDELALADEVNVRRRLYEFRKFITRFSEMFLF